VIENRNTTETETETKKKNKKKLSLFVTSRYKAGTKKAQI
jgi:hypothetical protein